jgi:hypothetical protein
MKRLILIILCSEMFFAAGAETRIRTQVSSNSITPYESITYRISVDISDGSDYSAVPQPELPQDLPFTVVAHPRSVSSSTQSTFINGKHNFQRKYTVVFDFELTPRRSGVLNIPSVPIEIKGEKYVTDAISINVGDSASSPHRHVSLTQSVSPAAVIGNPVVVTLKISIPVNGEYSDITPTIPWEAIEEVASINEPVETMKWQRSSRTVNGIAMQEFTLRIPLLPHKPGNYTIPPFNCIMSVPAEGRRSRSPFDSFFGVPMKQLAFASNECTFTVSPLPTENQPADFSGIIGKITASAFTELHEFSVGDPILLNISISGAASPKAIRLTNAILEKSLSPNFRVSGDDPPIVRDGEALFQRTIRAASHKVTEIPGIALSYYEPESGQYRTAVTNPIPITVKAAREITLEDATIAGSVPRREEAERQAATEISRASAGLSPDRPVADITGHGISPLDRWQRLAPWFALPAAFWLLAFCIRMLILMCTASPRKRRIRAAAERCLKLLHNHDVASKEDIELLNSAFQEFLAAKFRLIPGTITFSDIQGKATALDGQKLETLRKFLEICENARYAGGSVSLDEIRQPLSQILRKS